MTRVKRGTVKRQKHKKVLKETKGFYGSASRSYRIAKELLLKAMSYNYIDRKNKKRTFRRLWISRINSAARLNGLSYNQFINGLKKGNIDINRKMLSEIAISEPETFKKLIDVAKEQLSA